VSDGPMASVIEKELGDDEEEEDEFSEVVALLMLLFDEVEIAFALVDCSDVNLDAVAAAVAAALEGGRSVVTLAILLAAAITVVDSDLTVCLF